MKIETKFDIGQEVNCLIGYTDNKIHKAVIEAIFVKNYKEDDLNTVNYSITDKYGYAHIIPEEQVFVTQEEAEAKLKESI